MPGMLTEGLNTQAPGLPPGAPPSPGPAPQTPPVESPSGTPSLDGAPGSGQPQKQSTAGFEELRDQAVEQMYGKNFDNMIKMFQTNGAAQFPRSMAVAVNGAIDFLEKKNGKLPPEIAAEVGMDVMMKLLEDVITGGVVPDVRLEQVQQAFPAILVMYADARPDVSKEDMQALVQEVEKGVKAQGGGGAASPPGDPNAQPSAPSAPSAPPPAGGPPMPPAGGPSMPPAAPPPGMM